MNGQTSLGGPWRADDNFTWVTMHRPGTATQGHTFASGTCARSYARTRPADVRDCRIDRSHGRYVEEVETVRGEPG